MKKKILAGVLSVALLLALLPGNVFATEGDPPCGGTHAGASAISADGGSLTAGTWYLSADTTLTADLSVGAGVEVILCLNGHTLTGTGSGSVISISGGSLTLCDCAGGGSVTGGRAAQGGGVRMSAGTFEMYGGAVHGCTADGGDTGTGMGGGVYLSGGSFSMYGGSITECTATGKNGYGGGVYLTPSCDFLIDGGKIVDCKATGTSMSGVGGGVYGDSSVTVSGKQFLMRSGTIKGCTAEGSFVGYGGGVYLSDNFTFSMAGGSIENCFTSFRGGGVCINAAGKFLMSGDAEIISCGVKGADLTSQGGGISADAKSRVELTGGTIQNCSAQRGGGIHNTAKQNPNTGYFTASGITVSGCTAKSEGGGIHNTGDLALTGSTVTGCTAGRTGGGIYNEGDIELTDSTVKSCKASVGNAAGAYQGGGIYDNGRLSVCLPVSIKENTVNDTANNLYLCTDKTVTLSETMAEWDHENTAVEELRSATDIGVTVESGGKIVNLATASPGVMGLMAGFSGLFYSDVPLYDIDYTANASGAVVQLYKPHFSVQPTADNHYTATLYSGFSTGATYQWYRAVPGSSGATYTVLSDGEKKVTPVKGVYTGIDESMVVIAEGLKEGQRFHFTLSEPLDPGSS